VTLLQTHITQTSVITRHAIVGTQNKLQLN